MAQRRVARLLGMLTIAALVGGGLPDGGGAARAAAPPHFSDVPPSFWAAGAIDRLAAQGVLRGVGGGLFDPQGTLTRAQFATMLARLTKAPVDTVGPRFGDVPAGTWYTAGVAAATGLGWMEGVAPGRFDPLATVTRAQAAVAVVNELGLVHVAADQAGTSLPFADAAAIPAYAHGSAVVADQLGLMVGAGGDFLPNAPLDRAQAATLLVRLEGVTTAGLQAEGDRVARYVHIFLGQGALGPGASTGVTAYAHDAAGYVVPASFSWSATGGSVRPGAGSEFQGVATLTAAAGGSAAVTATVAGGSVAASATAPIEAASRLRLAPTPPAVLASSTLPLSVQVLQASGAVDAAAAGLGVTAVATPTGGGTPLRAIGTLGQAGATLTLPALPVGAYTLSVAAPGLAPTLRTLRSVAAPVGALSLGVRGAATVPVGGYVNVEGGVAVAGQTPAAASGTAASSAVASAASGTAASSAAGAAGDWPLQISVAGRQSALPRLTGEGRFPETLAVNVASAVLPSAGGPVAVILGNAVGAGRVLVSVPGGALTPASLPLQATPTGTFGAAVAAAPVAAGQPATVAVHLASGPAAGVPVYLEPIDPAGHPLPWIRAVVGGGLAQATLTPRQAGTWTFRWRAYGVAPVAAGSLQVLPGPARSLVVDPTPTSILLPGQTAQVKAWVADAFGNAVATRFTLGAAPLSGGGGVFTLGAASLAGPRNVGTFTAGRTPGTTTVTFTSPGLPPARVTFRTVATPADRLAGKGGWVVFPDWRSERTAGILARALAQGDTHLYVEVATTSDGFYGGRALDSLLRQAHADGIAVISWVYAGLENPAKDTATLRQVATYTTPSGDRADGVALDLEEVMTPSVLAAYTAAAKAAEGPGGLTVAVTYPPQYGPPTPFAAIAPNVQAIAPMDYWHILQGDYNYNFVYHWVRNSIALVRQRSGVPAMPMDVIAQTYDAFAGGSGQGIYSPTGAELAAAVRAARDGGAVGVSFYRPATATPAELRVMDAPW